MKLDQEFYLKGVAAAKVAFDVAGIHEPKSTKPPMGTPTPQASPPALPTDQNVLTGISANMLQNNALTHTDKFVQPMMKASEFNFGLHGKPVVPDRIAPDNGRSVLGTNFSEPWRQHHNSLVSAAFNQLGDQKNVDFLNEAGQGMIGATPRGG